MLARDCAAFEDLGSKAHEEFDDGPTMRKDFLAVTSASLGDGSLIYTYR